MKFVGSMCGIGFAIHMYFVWCFYELPAFATMDAPQREALVMINLGLTLFFGAASVLLLVFSTRPLTFESRLTVRAVVAVLAVRLILEFIFPVRVPVSPVFASHTTLVFKLLLGSIVAVAAIVELRRR
jgi:hypothetical protein